MSMAAIIRGLNIIKGPDKLLEILNNEICEFYCNNFIFQGKEIPEDLLTYKLKEFKENFKKKEFAKQVIKDLKKKTIRLEDLPIYYIISREIYEKIKPEVRCLFEEKRKEINCLMKFSEKVLESPDVELGKKIGYSVVLEQIIEEASQYI